VKYWVRFFFILFLFFLTSCGRDVPIIQKLAPLPAQGSCKIAVLPFLNNIPYPQGGPIVNKIFLSELVATDRFQVFLEGDIDSIYQQLLIYPLQQPTREQLEIIGGRLNPDLFIGGTILKMHERKQGDYVNTEMTIILHLYDGQSGQLLWSTYHHRLGSEYQQIMHLGRINSISGLARRMFQEIITDWLEQGMIPCAE
jgi:polysaccharide biosynthesis protein PelC